MTEYSGTITAGGSGQPVAGANANRSRLKYQNNSGGPLNFSADTAQPASATVGMTVPGGANTIYEWPSLPVIQGVKTPPVPAGAITVWGLTTGQSYYVEEA